MMEAESVSDETLIAELRKVAGMVWDQAELAGRDPGFDRRNFGASALVRPADTAEVVALVRFCAAHGLSLVAQGGRTGLTGAATTVPGQIICDLGAMHQVEEIDPLARVAIVQAGTPLGTLQAAALAQGLDPDIDLAARGSAPLAAWFPPMPAARMMLKTR